MFMAGTLAALGVPERRRSTIPGHMTDDSAAPAPVRGTAPWGSTHAHPDGFQPFPAEAVEGSIGDRFDRVASQRTDHVALRSPSGEWRFGELDEATNRI